MRINKRLPQSMYDKANRVCKCRGPNHKFLYETCSVACFLICLITVRGDIQLRTGQPRSLNYAHWTNTAGVVYCPFPLETSSPGKRKIAIKQPSGKINIIIIDFPTRIAGYIVSFPPSDSQITPHGKPTLL